MKRIAGWLIGDENLTPFEQRIYNFCILLGAVVTLAGVIVDWITYSTFTAYSALFFVLWIASYALTRFMGYYRIVVPLSIALLVAAFFPISWLTSAGILGVMPYYSILFIAVACAVTSGRVRLILVAVYALIQGALILLRAYPAGYLEAQLSAGQRQMDALIHLTIITLSVSAMLIVYSNTYRRERARGEAYAKAIEENYRQQIYYMENLEQLVGRLRAERHDYNNHLGIIYGLLEDGEAGEAKRYAASLVRAAREHQNLVALPYSMLRAMINYKLSVAAEQSIRLNLAVDVPPGLSFNEPDLAIIIGLLLDNAVEACQGIQDKYIALCLCYKPDYLTLRIENPTNPGVEAPAWQDGRFRTSKPDSDDHGFGLSNIKYLVEKHDGLMEIDCRKATFKVSIALLIDAQESA